MSLDYWTMKLGGAFVNHKGSFHRIENISHAGIGVERAEFPEEMLPFLLFNIGKEHPVRYKDFSIFFPDDQAYLNREGKMFFAKRSMSRQYKIAPTSEMFSVRDTGSMISFLKQGMSPEFRAPEDVCLFDRVDKIFSRNVALRGKTPSRLRSDILHKGVRVMSLTKTKNSIELVPIGTGKLPSEVVELFSDFMGWKIPYTSAPVQDPETLRAVRFIEYHSHGHERSGEYSVVSERGHSPLPASFQFKRREGRISDRIILISSTDDLSALINNNIIFPEEYLGVMNYIGGEHNGWQFQ